MNFIIYYMLAGIAVLLFFLIVAILAAPGPKDMRKHSR